MNTGELIGKLAQARGINLHQLATKAGIPYNSLYSVVKRNSSRVGSKTLQAIADALDVPVSTFMEFPQAPKSIGQKIRDARIEVGLTQQELAEKLSNRPGSVTQEAIAMLEQADGVDDFDALSLWKIAVNMGVSVGKLIDLNPEEERRVAAAKAAMEICAGQDGYDLLYRDAMTLIRDNITTALERYQKKLDALESQRVQMESQAAAISRKKREGQFDQDWEELQAVFYSLNDLGRKEFIKRGKEMTQLPAYQRP